MFLSAILLFCVHLYASCSLPLSLSVVFSLCVYFFSLSLSFILFFSLYLFPLAPLSLSLLSLTVFCQTVHPYICMTVCLFGCFISLSVGFTFALFVHPIARPSVVQADWSLMPLHLWSITEEHFWNCSRRRLRPSTQWVVNPRFERYDVSCWSYINDGWMEGMKGGRDEG